MGGQYLPYHSHMYARLGFSVLNMNALFFKSSPLMEARASLWLPSSSLPLYTALRYSIWFSFWRNLSRILPACSSLDRLLVKSAAQLSSWDLPPASSCLWFLSPSSPYVERIPCISCLSCFIPSFVVHVSGDHTLQVPSKTGGVEITKQRFETL